jgi:hypothetical protein
MAMRGFLVDDSLLLLLYGKRFLAKPVEGGTSTMSRSFMNLVRERANSFCVNQIKQMPTRKIIDGVHFILTSM